MYYSLQAFVDNRFSPSLIRPMQELSNSDCAAVIACCGLPPVPPEARGPFSRSAGMGSLQGLTARVLRDLEPSFPATNFAVLRTAGKMAEAEGAARCRLCESVLPTEASGGEEEPRESAVGDLRFCHALATGQEVFDQPELCYGCSVLAQKNVSSRLDWTFPVNL